MKVEGWFECDQCHWKSGTELALLLHKSKKHLDNVCPTCAEVFKGAQALTIHEKLLGHDVSAYPTFEVGDTVLVSDPAYFYVGFGVVSPVFYGKICTVTKNFTTKSVVQLPSGAGNTIHNAYLTKVTSETLLRMAGLMDD